MNGIVDVDPWAAHAYGERNKAHAAPAEDRWTPRAAWTDRRAASRFWLYNTNVLFERQAAFQSNAAGSCSFACERSLLEGRSLQNICCTLSAGDDEY